MSVSGSQVVGMFGALPTSGSQAGGAGGLSQSNFLNLLVAELQNQDPLNPLSSDSFIQQLATLTDVSAVGQMTQAMTDLLDLSAAASAVRLIGQNVTVAIAGGSTVQGTVSGVEAGAGGPQVVVSGTAYPLSSVVAVGSVPGAGSSP
jgi:flagellar basal-body rod modification protein FlgD